MLPAAPDPQPAPAVAPQSRAAGVDAQPQAPIDTADPRWIARLADEIARTAGDDGRARFRLNPEALGSMEVTVRHTAEGVSVRFEVESEQTRALIAHVEHRLQAEARANGLRIAETQVDLAGQHQQQGGRERPAEQPLVAIRAAVDTDPIQSGGETVASARYA
ncbi:flagellar hook-length control protein FliK [Sphingomonas gilva]|uniref:flagellar hook-length control protein FliK n=1 Tax=Sphingomonas gilva TaxID=2305907 RepID=UPI0015FB4E98|nr:flagellar hook-length control protein FliK [Sphingomonas gilva]